MRVKSLLAALLLILACMQTMSAQGFRVYQNDGTEMQFFMSTDSIVFFEGASVGGNTGEVHSGPFTPLNQMITGTWYYGKDKSITFRSNGKTDFFEGATFKFFPYQGTIIIYSVSGQPAFIFRVLDKTNRQMILNDESNGMYFLSKKAPEPSDEHEWVDLGLPSGTLWATCNVGASCPEEYGDYFAWGETKPKTSYTLENWKFWSSLIHNYNWNQGEELKRSDDAATVNWGCDWRTPSKEQFSELTDERYTFTRFTMQHGVYGEKITSKINGESIFLPAAGCRSMADLNGAGIAVIYMSSSCDWYHCSNAAQGNFFIIPEGTIIDGYEFQEMVKINDYCLSGCSVRPVRVD